MPKIHRGEGRVLSRGERKRRRRLKAKGLLRGKRKRILDRLKGVTVRRASDRHVASHITSGFRRPQLVREKNEGSEKVFVFR